MYISDCDDTLVSCSVHAWNGFGVLTSHGVSENGITESLVYNIYIGTIYYNCAMTSDSTPTYVKCERICECSLIAYTSHSHYNSHYGSLTNPSQSFSGT